MENKPFIARFYQYINERYPLTQFVPLSFIFGFHASLFSQLFFNVNFSLILAFTTSILLLLFLFRLRLFDEFKDYEHDKKYYPTRPIPRGLLSFKDLRLLIFGVIALEVAISLYLGTVATAFFIIAFVYSLLLLKEFFISSWLRNHFTTYIIVHEFLAIPLFYYLYAVNQIEFGFVTNSNILIHSIFLTSSFFTLEVARKIRAPEKEIPSRDTYSAQYGINGSVKLLMALVASSLVLAIVLYFKNDILAFWTLPPAFFSMLFLGRAVNKFIKNPTIQLSKRVFMISIIYTILLNVGVITALLLKT